MSGRSRVLSRNTRLGLGVAAAEGFGFIQRGVGFFASDGNQDENCIHGASCFRPRMCGILATRRPLASANAACAAALDAARQRTEQGNAGA